MRYICIVFVLVAMTSGCRDDPDVECFYTDGYSACYYNDYLYLTDGELLDEEFRLIELLEDPASRRDHVELHLEAVRLVLGRRGYDINPLPEVR